MRRIDALAIGLGVLALGGILYLGLTVFGVPGITAGHWAQLVLVIGLVGWLASYVFRVNGRNMTFNTQMRDYKEAVLQKRREEQSGAEVKGDPSKTGK